MLIASLELRRKSSTTENTYTVTRHPRQSTAYFCARGAHLVTLPFLLPSIALAASFDSETGHGLEQWDISIMISLPTFARKYTLGSKFCPILTGKYYALAINAITQRQKIIGQLPSGGAITSIALEEQPDHWQARGRIEDLLLCV